jgi:hypothetical protein
MNVHKIQQQAKQIIPFVDLYGTDALFKVLMQYPYVSWRDKTIPTQGSPTRLSKDISLENTKQFKLIKFISHKDGKSTVFTDKGVYQFFAIGQQLTTNNK